MLTESPATELAEIGNEGAASRARPVASARSGHVLGFDRNTEIYAEGEAARYVYKVMSGVVRVSKLLPDGRRQISAFHLPGDMFGFEPDDVHSASAEAVVPTRLLAVRWQSLGAPGASPGFMRELLALAMAELRHFEGHLMLLGRKTALERVAAFLLEMASRTGISKMLELAMPRHDIADYLGLTLETVSRSLAELKELGVIELPSARRVHLRDRTALKAMAA